MAPLQTQVLRPIRCVSQTARMDIECCSYSDHDLGGKARAVDGHESFLLWGAEPDPEKIRVYGKHCVLKPVDLGFCQRPKRRSARPHDPNARKSREQHAFQFIGNPLIATVEKVGVPPRHRTRTKLSH